MCVRVCERGPCASLAQHENTLLGHAGSTFSKRVKAHLQLGGGTHTHTKKEKMLATFFVCFVCPHKDSLSSNCVGGDKEQITIIQLVQSGAAWNMLEGTIRIGGCLWGRPGVAFENTRYQGGISLTSMV